MFCVTAGDNKAIVPRGSIPEQILVDRDDRVHLIVRGNGGLLRYATNRRGEWEAETASVLSSSVHGVSGVVDGRGRIHISYIEPLARDDRIVKYLAKGGEGWHTETIVRLIEAHANFTRIAIDSKDRVYVFYDYSRQPGTLRYVIRGVEHAR
jgi:hypothetical protein